ncbi:hypothetical protein [Roseateles sp. BYS96W]|uniref:Uncharacterized protein n=1 Tax=Pelomonas nitida TaxID=3299027 RepID=A0ABW7G5M8_9BURK
MQEREKLAIAAHLHVVMRRKTGRVTDVEWLVRNNDYAREIIKLALSEPDQSELHEWARKLRSALFVPAPDSKPSSRGEAALVPAKSKSTSRRFLDSLR